MSTGSAWLQQVDSLGQREEQDVVDIRLETVPGGRLGRALNATIIKL